MWNCENMGLGAGVFGVWRCADAQSKDRINPRIAGIGGRAGARVVEPGWRHGTIVTETESSRRVTAGQDSRSAHQWRSFLRMRSYWLCFYNSTNECLLRMLAGCWKGKARAWRMSLQDDCASCRIDFPQDDSGFCDCTNRRVFFSCAEPLATPFHPHFCISASTLKTITPSSSNPAVLSNTVHALNSTIIPIHYPQNINSKLCFIR